MMRFNIFLHIGVLSALLLAGASMPTQVTGAEFRQFRPIPVPQQAGAGRGARTDAGIKPVSRQLVGQAVDRLMSAWNENRMDGVLGKYFFDGSRLNDAMNTKVPRDAQLSVLAIQNVQTLSQKRLDSPSGRLLVSAVSVTVKTQLTFNDSVNGFQRRKGVNEYIIRIKQLARRKR